MVSTLVDTGRCSIVIDVPETLHSQRERGRVTAQGRRTDNTGCTLLVIQEADGSWWDYAMWDYHKPYGTAFAVMTLLR